MRTDENTLREETGHGWARWIQQASSATLQVERLALMTLMGLLTLVILLNVATRYSGMPIYWVDEAAVYLVVWLCFVGASATTRLRLDFVVTLLTDSLGARCALRIRALAATIVLLFGGALLLMCWLWMDPVGIARHGFDARAYAAESFNFLYTERTQTLNWPTWIVQLILPLFALSLSVHAAANLVEDLGLRQRAAIAGFGLGSAETSVN
ncbi:TRAP transporter small permease [Verminephrobacter aporrectodeae subsp. tuberculatae]|uniref:TRAP transporter small permease n=1 Tax=Verminephrobacter aporrectodeae TaxID=1110389 RepID=UPI0022376183|nr:TRAP transporter small permease [Verminephrobacter aporrectodeae]MCW5256388.1 TRAP transporter small permease [Verminephrobacter aporrectodeae subsp. tuberculatae]